MFIKICWHVGTILNVNLEKIIQKYNELGEFIQKIAQLNVFPKLWPLFYATIFFKNWLSSEWIFFNCGIIMLPKTYHRFFLQISIFCTLCQFLLELNIFNNLTSICRCPARYSGDSCEIIPPLALPEIQKQVQILEKPILNHRKMFWIMNFFIFRLFLTTF